MRRLDGSPYRPAVPGTGLVLARNEAVAGEIDRLVRIGGGVTE